MGDVIRPRGVWPAPASQGSVMPLVVQRHLETARPPVLLIAKDATKGRSERAVPMSAFVLSAPGRLHAVSESSRE